MKSRLEEYLKQVEARLGDKSASERRDILMQLRQHIRELMMLHNNDEEAVLMELDKPDAYAGDAPAEKPKSAPAGRGWFILAILFLLLNGLWVLMVARDRGYLNRQPKENAKSADPVAEEPAPVKEPEITDLALLEVAQRELSSAREVTLLLRFNVPPDTRVLHDYLQFTEKKGAKIEYSIVGGAEANVVLLKTDTVFEDRMNLQILAGLPAASGPAVLHKEVKREIEVVAEMALEELMTTMPDFGKGYVSLRFSMRLDTATAHDFIQITPAVDFVVEPMGWWWGAPEIIRGDFKPRETYTVTFKAGLRADNGSVLTRPVIRTVQFPDRDPALAIPTSGRYLSPKGNLQIPLSAMNVKEVEISAAPVLPQNLLYYALRVHGRVGWRWGSNANEDRMLGEPPLVLTNQLASRLNEEFNTRFDLRSLVDGAPSGAYWLSVAGARGAHANQLVVVTDIGLSARVAKDGLFVWVNSLSEAKPVVGAEVVAYAENNEEVGRGMVEEDGSVFLPKKEGVGAAYVLIARAGSDLSYLVLDGGEVEVPGRAGERDFPSGYEAYVFTERGVYRPGETAHVRAVLRDKKLTAPEAFPVSLRVVRPDGQVFRTLTMKVDGVGSCETNFVMPEFLPTGRYSFDIILPGSDRVLGSTTVALEDFVPPQIRVDIFGLPDSIAAGEAFNFTASARHLFGAAAVNLPVSAFLRYYPVPFVATNWAGYSFGDAEKDFSFPLTYLGKTRLDMDGLAEFTATSSPAWRPAARLRAVVSANVFESGGRAVSASAETTVDPYPFYIGLSPSFSGTLRVGDTQRVSVVAVQPSNLTALTNGALKAVLSRVAQSWALRRGANGRYSYESFETLTPIREVALSLGAKPAALPLHVDASGEYLLVISDPESGASSSIRFSAAAPGEPWVDWNRERPDLIELSLDKKSYQPGDVARLVAKAPFAGEGLLTVETDSILEHRRVTLSGSTAEFEIPVTEEFSPNVYCTLTLIRPAVAEAQWSAHRAVGAVSLEVRPKGHGLSVAIDAPGTNLPQSKLTAKIHVRNEAGEPAAARLTVMAVDEGICALTGFKTPDALKYFLAKRNLGIAWFDLYSELMPILDDEMNQAASHIGGDAGSSLLRRLNPIKARRFKPLALWQSEIETDADGGAEVSFDLPEFSGEVRLMAVAMTREELGSAQASVKVKRPLVVGTSLPRFLAPGDVSTLTVQLFNESGAEQHVKIEVTVSGPVSIENTTRTVTLPAGQSANELIDVRALEGTGTALISVRAVSEAVSFSDQIELPVRPPLALRTESVWGKLSAGEKIEFDKSKVYLTNTIQQIVQASGLPDVKLGRALDYLQTYPYWCLEQTASRAYPLLYMPELAKRVAGTSMDREEVEPYIRKSILNILANQLPDGSFSMWPFARNAWEWGSLYAAGFLSEAHRMGYDVPEGQLRAALSYAEHRLRMRPPVSVDPEDAGWRYDIEERAFACEILARAGQRADGWIARLAEQSDLLPISAKISLVRALIASGDPRRGGEILNTINPESAHDVVDASALLLAWLDLNPESPVVPLLARAIEQDVSPEGHWMTTTRNSYAIRALGAYAALMTNAQEDFSARLLRGTEAVEFDQSRVFRATNSGPVTLVNDGPGPLYYRVSASGVPVSGKPDIGDNGLKVRSQWFDMFGEKLDLEKFKQSDLVIVQLTVDSQGHYADDLIVEDLLPAGFEIENPSLQTAQDTGFGWITGKVDWVSSRDIRDDRLLLFSGPFNGEQTYYYAMRAVTPGRYVVPAVTVSGMYDPMRRSVWRGKEEVQVVP